MTNSIEDKRRGAETNRKKALERDALVLDWLEEGLTYREVADRLMSRYPKMKSESTVRTVILRARRRAGIPPRTYGTKEN